MQYDAIVIGTGQAGVPLAQRMAKAGWKVAIIEKTHFGGSCVNTGCIPTKAYIESARSAHVARHAADMGVSISGTVKVDLQKVKARKDRFVLDSRKANEQGLREADNITVYEGKGTFSGPHTVEVNGEELTAEKIFINVGARARVPDTFAEVDYLTNREILELETLPAHLIIIGGSYIGLEFGQMFRRFGSQVTIIENSDRLIDQEDEDISAAVLEIMQQEEVTVHLGADSLSATQEDEEIAVEMERDNKSITVTGSHLLLAVGRTPNTDDLGLDKAGVKTDKHSHIQVNQHLETNVKGIWALGDCNGEGQFTHTSYDDFKIVENQLFGDGKRQLSDRIDCYALYTDPALGRVGLTAKQAKDAGKKINVAQIPMENISRAKLKGETQGLMKVVVDTKTDKILGAAVLGPNGDEIIHAFIDTMYADQPYTLIRDAMHIHPTVSELLPSMMEDLEEEEE